jgi:hypothetical protein
MKASLLKVLVVTLSFAAVGLLSLSSSRAADSSSSAQTDPMGGCCGQQPAAEDSGPPPVTCGQGTIPRGNTCVNANR